MATFRGTTGTDRFIGGSADDAFLFDASQLSSSDVLRGGGGANALALTNTGSSFASFNSTSLKGLSNIAGIVLGTAPNGFKFALTDAFFTTNHESTIAFDASRSTSVQGFLQLDASRVSKIKFKIIGSTGANDVLRTGAGNDEFLYVGNSLLVGDAIDGGKGVDTLVLAGAGATTRVKDGGTYTNPNGLTALANVKNVENIVVTGLAKGQSRTIDFGNVAGTAKYEGGSISISTNKTYGGTKTAAIDGTLIVDGSRLKSTQALTVTGGNAGDVLTGGAARDTLNDGNGNDTLQGGVGGDRLVGGAGNDVFVVSDASFGTAASQFYRDSIDGGSGSDTLRFTAKNGVKISSAALSANTVTGIETIQFAGYQNASVYSIALDSSFTAHNHDSSGHLVIADQFSFSARRLIVDASLSASKYGIQVQVNGGGTETLKGGAGADIFDYSKVVSGHETVTLADTINGGGSSDSILFSEGAHAQLGTSVAGVELVKVLANSPNATTTEIDLATKGAITINGSALGASDTLVVAGTFDKNAATGGTPSKVSATGPITIIGGHGADTLIGGLGKDTISGGEGADSILGGQGADVLSGGAGADAFYYTATTDSPPTARDTILDFKQADHDTIYFLHTNSTTPFTFIGDAGFGHHAGEVRASAGASTTTVELDVNGDAQADLSIVLKGHITLTQSDFHL